MRIKRESGGSLILHFGGDEAVFFRSFAAEMRAQVEHPDFTRRAVRRLFPRCCEDEKTDGELRSLLFDEQRKQKLERIDAFAAALAKIPAAGGDVKLSPQEIEHWLALLTDLRFIYADAAGIDSDDANAEINPEPTRELFIYEYLTGLQQMLLGLGFGYNEDPAWRDAT